MNKRDETIELLAKGLNYNLRYDTLDEIEIEKVTYHCDSGDLDTQILADKYIMLYILPQLEELSKQLSLINNASTTALRKIQSLNRDIKVDTVDLRKAIEDTEELVEGKNNVLG